MSKRTRKPLTAAEKAKREEEKTANFVRLAKKRVDAAVTKIGYVGNCFAAAYNWTPQQAAKVIAALADAVANVEAKSNKMQQRTDSFEF